MKSRTISRIVSTCVFGFLFLVSTTITEGLSKEWNGITPCFSTRSDAEKKLGKDDSTIRSFGSYVYNNLRVSVHYVIDSSLRPELNLVQKIDVYPERSIKLNRYIKAIPNFQKDFLRTALPDEITHVNKLAVYRNWAEGFEIWVQKNENDQEVVTRFGYFAPNLHLRSKSSASWCS